MRKIAATLKTLGGLTEEDLVPRVFHPRLEGMAQQLSLFEEGVDWGLDLSTQAVRRSCSPNVRAKKPSVPSCFGHIVHHAGKAAFILQAPSL